MPRLRLDLDERTFDALAKVAVIELRPIAWQAEMIIRQHLQAGGSEELPKPQRVSGDRPNQGGNRDAA